METAQMALEERKNSFMKPKFQNSLEKSEQYAISLRKKKKQQKISDLRSKRVSNPFWNCALFQSEQKQNQSQDTSLSWNESNEGLQNKPQLNFLSLVQLAKQMWKECISMCQKEQVDRVENILWQIINRLNSQPDKLDQFIEEMISESFICLLEEMQSMFPNLVSQALVYLSFGQIQASTYNQLEGMLRKIYEQAFSRSGAFMTNPVFKTDCYLLIGNLGQESVYLRDRIFGFPGLMEELKKDSEDQQMAEITTWALSSLLKEDPLPDPGILLYSLEICKICLNTSIFVSELKKSCPNSPSTMVINILQILNYITQNSNISRKCFKFLLEELIQILSSIPSCQESSAQTHVRLIYLLSILTKITSTLKSKYVKVLLYHPQLLSQILRLQTFYYQSDTVETKFVYIWMNLFANKEAISYLIQDYQLAAFVFCAPDCSKNKKLFKARLDLLQNFFRVARIESVNEVEQQFNLIGNFVTALEILVERKDISMVQLLLKRLVRIVKHDESLRFLVLQRLKETKMISRMELVLNIIVDQMAANRKTYVLAVDLLDKHLKEIGELASDSNDEEEYRGAFSI